MPSCKPGVQEALTEAAEGGSGYMGFFCSPRGPRQAELLRPPLAWMRRGKETMSKEADAARGVSALDPCTPFSPSFSGEKGRKAFRGRGILWQAQAERLGVQNLSHPGEKGLWLGWGKSKLHPTLPRASAPCAPGWP